jgi:hypothetical protein
MDFQYDYHTLMLLHEVHKDIKLILSLQGCMYPIYRGTAMDIPCGTCKVCLAKKEIEND